MSHIGSTDDFPDNSATSVEAQGRSILVVRRAGDVYLYHNSCPHTRETLDPMGGSVASEDGLLLRCQRHAAEFLSDSGECVSGPCQGEQLEAVPFTLGGADIYLD